MKCSELLRLLNKNGWQIVRQSGSHILMQHPLRANKLIIPYHSGKEVKKGLLLSILKEANIKTGKR